MRPNVYGPVRRAAGILGLLALAPTGIGLLQDTLTPADAAMRGAVTLVVASLVTRVASWWLRSAVERPQPAAADDHSLADPAGPAGAGATAAATPGRRSTDNPPAAT
jgi:hypothetical protein